MALEGEIKEFGVADILQLMAQQQKTGVLMVECKDQSAEIHFVNGEVVETRSTEYADRLGEMLVKGRVLSREELNFVLDKQKDTFEPLVQILLREGLLKKDDLDRIVRTQSYEIFYDILQWREGSYRFISDKVKAGGAQTSLPGLESILLDVLRMIDEWPDVKKVIRSFDMVFGKKEDRNFGELEADELPVYTLLDGKNSVEEVIAGTLMGRFEVCKILVGLLEDGFIELVAERAVKEKVDGTGVRKKVVTAGAYAGVAAALCLLLLLPTQFPKNILPALAMEYVQRSPLPGYRFHCLVQKLEAALGVFFMKNGVYPETLQELVRAGILRERDLSARSIRSAAYYTSRGGGYVLEVSSDAP